MGKHLEIENIEEMRRQVGIDDVELREAVRRLRVGDYVNLTLLTGTHSAAGRIIRVRITHTDGASFRGRLAEDFNGNADPVARAHLPRAAGR